VFGERPVVLTSHDVVKSAPTTAAISRCARTKRRDVIEQPRGGPPGASPNAQPISAMQGLSHSSIAGNGRLSQGGWSRRRPCEFRSLPTGFYVVPFRFHPWSTGGARVLSSACLAEVRSAEACSQSGRMQSPRTLPDPPRWTVENRQFMDGKRPLTATRACG
jgi:hypothetical protein